MQGCDINQVRQTRKRGIPIVLTHGRAVGEVQPEGAPAIFDGDGRNKKPLIVTGPGRGFRRAGRVKPYFTRYEKITLAIIVAAILLAIVNWQLSIAKQITPEGEDSSRLAAAMTGSPDEGASSQIWTGDATALTRPISLYQSQITNQKSKITKTEADLGSGKEEAPSSLTRRHTSPPTRSDNSGAVSDQRSAISVGKNFFAAIRVEESRDGEVTVGDGGLSRGDYHITGACWTDGCEQGGVRWDYEIFVWSNRHCEQVMVWYFERYCPDALAALDYKIMARIHNGGPTGDRKPATLEYWRRIQEHMANRQGLGARDLGLGKNR